MKLAFVISYRMMEYTVSCKRSKNWEDYRFLRWLLPATTFMDYWLSACNYRTSRSVRNGLSTIIQTQDVCRKRNYFYILFRNTWPPHQPKLGFFCQEQHFMEQHRSSVLMTIHLPPAGTRLEACTRVQKHAWHSDCHPKCWFWDWLKRSLLN